ncbi:MAG: RidA family protein [Pirellulales bacterium]
MRSGTTLRLALLLGVCGIGYQAAVAADDLLYVQPDSASGSSGAVRVGATCLVHTEQVMAADSKGKIEGKDAAEQFPRVLQRLNRAGLDAGAGLDRCVKLNVYLKKSEDRAAIQALLAAEFSGEHKPAMAFVTTDLPHPDAFVAADAVIASPREAPPNVKVSAASEHAAAAALLPPGGRVYIAGQAEQGDLAAATRGTMQSLLKTLDHLGLNASHVVQIKSFLMPMGESAAARREILSFFEEGQAPPLVFVEWQSSETTPIEIELIAFAPASTLPANPPAVEYITPPGMSASPVFARVTRVAAKQTIYVSGLYGGQADDAELQVRDIFGQLDKLLRPAGSSLKHLAKATYYVANEPVSTALNKLRPEYYDPQRPPAASKAPVRGVGRGDRALTLDMIAVPAE